MIFLYLCINSSSNFVFTVWLVWKCNFRWLYFLWRFSWPTSIYSMSHLVCQSFYNMTTQQLFSVCMLCSFLLYCLADLTVEFKFFSTYICCCQHFLNTFLGWPGPFGLSTADKMEITMLKHQESASRGKIVSMLKF